MATITGSPVTVFASAAYTATQTSAEFRSGLAGGEGHFKGLALVFDCTAVTSTPSVVFTLEVATGNGSFAVVSTSAALTTAGTATALVTHPDVATSVANFADVGPMATKWRVVATAADANSCTYSVLGWPLQ